MRQKGPLPSLRHFQKVGICLKQKLAWTWAHLFQIHLFKSILIYIMYTSEINLFLYSLFSSGIWIFHLSNFSSQSLYYQCDFFKKYIQRQGLIYKMFSDHYIFVASVHVWTVHLNACSQGISALSCYSIM